MAYFTTSDNVKLYYEIAGNKEAHKALYSKDEGAHVPIYDKDKTEVLAHDKTLIFLHGITCNSGYFRKQIEALSNDFNVIVPDLRGHGQSETPKDGYTIARCAEDVRDLIKAVGATNVVLCGWSLGVTVVYEYLSRFGQDGLSGVIIADQAPREYGVYDAFDYKDAIDMCYMIMSDWDNFIPVFASQFFGDPEKCKEDYDWVIEQIKGCNRDVLLKMVIACFVTDYRRFVKEITLPTLILYGGEGKMYRTEDSIFTHSQIKGSKLVCLEGCGHAIQLEAADEFNEEVRAFVKSL